MSRTDDLTSIATLKEIFADTKLFLGEDDAIYARFLREGQEVTYPTFSPNFLAWFKGEASQRINSIPSTRVINQVISDTEYEVRQRNLPYPVASRIFPEDRSVLIRRGNAEVLEIDASGAALTRDSGVVFPTGSDIETLPEPEDANALDVLAEILDLSEDQCRLVLIWLMTLFQADGRLPMLVIIGPPQSGKTRMARNIRWLLDPERPPLLPLPSGLDELKAAVQDNAILAFDNVKKVPKSMEEPLLALARGTAFTVRPNARPVWYKRPTILVSEHLPDPPELMENAIVLRLKERPAQQFKNKTTLDRMFYRQWGKAFGSLVKLCSAALRHRDSVELTTVHRDADLERWILAVDRGLDLGGKLMEAYTSNLQGVIADIAGERPALRAFRALVRAEGSVKATATQLLDQIEPLLDCPKDARYPASGKAMSKLLRDHERFMTDIEIEFDVRTGKDRDRNIVATWRGPKTGKDKPPPRRPSVKAMIKRKRNASHASDQPSFL